MTEINPTFVQNIDCKFRARLFWNTYFWLFLLTALCGVSPTCLGATEQKDNHALLPLIALLFHGPYGERSYELTSNGDEALKLQEVDNGPVHFDVQSLPGRPCVFVAIRKTISGMDVEQLDLAKFDGTYQLRDTCNPSGPPLEQNCTSSLHFTSDPDGFCETIFKESPPDLNRISFPTGACRPFGLGGRKKEFYAKYIDAFKRVASKCGVGR